MEKHLFYYIQHSQYNEPTDKPAVSYCEQENEVHYAAAGSVTLITFTIASISYQAEEGMTWGEWVNSSYNTGGYIISDIYVTDSNHFTIYDVESSTYQHSTDLIVNNSNYYVESGN